MTQPLENIYEPKIKVTIAVAVYNVDNQYLTQCIESLMYQTLKEIEILLISDCTCEENLELMRAYAQKDSRIKLIQNKENRGLAGVRNQSIELAQGEYLCYVDNDDWLDPDICRRAYNHGVENEADIVLWTFQTWLAGECQRTNYWGPKEKLYVQNEMEELQVQVLDPTYSDEQQIPMVVTAWAKLYRTAFLKENPGIRFPEDLGTGGEDYSFNYRIFEVAQKAFFFEDYGYYYRQFPMSFTKRFREDEWENRNRWMQEVKRYVNWQSQRQKYAYERFCLSQLIGQCTVTYQHPNCTFSRREKRRELKQIIGQKEIKDALDDVENLQLKKSKKLYFFFLEKRMLGVVLGLSKVYSRKLK